MDRNEIINSVTEEFKKYQIWSDAEPHPQMSQIINVVVDGDWKHDHIATKNIMEKYGCKLLGDTLVEDYDDDSYRSIHHYYIMSED